MNGPEVDERREERRAQLLEEIEELKTNRLVARKDARSGNPAKRHQGQHAVAAITDLITARHQLLREEDES